MSVPHVAQFDPSIFVKLAGSSSMRSLLIDTVVRRAFRYLPDLKDRMAIEAPHFDLIATTPTTGMAAVQAIVRYEWAVLQRHGFQ